MVKTMACSSLQSAFCTDRSHIHISSDNDDDDDGDDDDDDDDKGLQKDWTSSLSLAQAALTF